MQRAFSTLIPTVDVTLEELSAFQQEWQEASVVHAGSKGIALFSVVLVVIDGQSLRAQNTTTPLVNFPVGLLLEYNLSYRSGSGSEDASMQNTR